MKYIDNFLNGITMYKLVLYGLTILSLIAIALGFFEILSYGGLSLIFTLIILLVTCFVTNQLFSTIFKVQTNVESVWITSYILFFCFISSSYNK